MNDGGTDGSRFIRSQRKRLAIISKKEDGDREVNSVIELLMAGRRAQNDEVRRIVEEQENPKGDDSYDFLANKNLKLTFFSKKSKQKYENLERERKTGLD